MIARGNRRDIPRGAMQHRALIAFWPWRHLRVAECQLCGCGAAHRDLDTAITWVVVQHIRHNERFVGADEPA